MDQVDSYYKSLSLDAEQLGINNCSPELPDSFDNMHARLSSFSRIITKPEQLEDLDPNSLQTEIGRQTLRIVQTSKFQPNFTGLGLCRWVEHYTASSFDTKNMMNASRPTPIILTQDNRAVAIVKHYESQNVYGLYDSPEHNLFKGIIHRLGSGIVLSPPPRVAQPWQLDICHVPLAPGRPSAFLIPTANRIGTPRESRVLQTEHAHIVAMADEALRNAHPYTLAG